MTFKLPFYFKIRLELIIAGIISGWLFCGMGEARQTGRGILRGKVMVSVAGDPTEELLRERVLTRYEAHGATSREQVRPYNLSEKAVVYIESATIPEMQVDSVAPHPQLNQSQMLFHPLVLPVMVGTTVDFPNNDNLFHNVFSYSQPKEFDLGRYPRGKIKSVLFDKPGVVKIYCDIHSYMYALVLVLENPYFAVPDDDGNFQLNDIPPGTYKLCLWYGRKKAETKTVLVEEGKTTVVNFEY